LKAATPQAAGSARDQAQSQLRRLDEDCEPFATAAAQRLVHALALLEVDAVRDQVSDGPDRRAEARAVYPCASHLGGIVAPHFAGLNGSRVVLLRALQVLSNEETNERRINAALRAAGLLRGQLEEIRRKVGEVVYYPFEHASKHVTLARFAFPAVLPAENDLSGLLDAANEALERLAGAYRRALGRLVVSAEEVERVLGLPPIQVERAIESAADAAGRE
jgi:hypothetical protein